jgi:hypothetical protein
MSIRNNPHVTASNRSSPGQDHTAKTPSQQDQDNAGMTETDEPDAMLEVILALLAPIMMTGGITDARLAARQAIAAYKGYGQHQLVAIAQVVGFAIASLDNLRLAMAADLPVPMKLKLRGNAAVLSRASQQASTTLDSQRRNAAAPPEHPGEQQSPSVEPDPDEVQRQAKVLASLEQARDLVQQAQVTLKVDPSAEPLTQLQRDLSWASAMTGVAAEYSAGLDQLPPAQRRIDLLRISALAKTARALSRGDVPLKSRLPGATSPRG